MASRDSRFSTYSGAPSIQPSLANTLDTQRSSARASQQQYNEKSSRMPYGNSDPAASDSSSTLSSTDPKTADLKQWSGTLERMQDKRLDSQRYVMNENKSDEVSKLALGAKVERALARRMTGQDAQFSSKKVMNSEKRNLEVEAN